MLLFVGTFTARLSGPLINVNVTRHWLKLMVCVTDPSRMRHTLAILAASDVKTVNVVPYRIELGALIVGRAPFNKYGGDKISQFSSESAFEPRPPPAAITRASGRSIAVE